MALFKSVLGALLLLILCLCALGAANASATSTYECVNVLPGTGTFGDSHCSAGKEKGEFATVKIEELSVLMSEPSAFSLSGKIVGIAVQVTCAGMSGSGTGKNIVNEKEENEAEGSGFVLKFTECVVVEPPGKGCVVKAEAFQTAALSMLTSMQAEATNVTFSPPSGKPIAEVTIEKCTVGSLNGTFKVEGTLVGTVNAKSPSKLEFTKAGTEGGGLTFAGSKGGLGGSYRTVGGGPNAGTLAIEPS